LKSAMRQAVGWSNFYFELWQICCLNNKLRLKYN
jgi:hypothetical protein